MRVQGPLVLDGGTELYPDFALLVRRSDYYRDAPPTPGAVLLVVEVSDTTVEYDRGIKRPLYARAGVPEVWILDLRERRIDVYRRPDAGEYREQTHVVSGQSLPIPGIEGEQVQASEVVA